MAETVTITGIERARQAGARAEMRRDAVLRRAAWAGAAWLAGWVVLSAVAAPRTPVGDVRDRALYLVPVVLGIALAGVAAVRGRAPSRPFWALLCASGACSLVGNLGDAWASYVADSPALETAIAAVYLVSYAFLLPALGAGLRGRFPGTRARTALDALLVLFCLGACAWVVLVSPAIGDLRGFVDLSSLAYPLLDATVLTLVVGLGLCAGRLTVVTALVAGVMALNAVADSGTAYLTVVHVAIEDRVVNAIYQVGLVAFAFAALIAVRHDEPQPAADGVGADRGLLLVVPALAGLTAALASTASHGSLPVSSALIGTAAAALLTARTVAQSREHRLTAARLAVLLREEEQVASADALTGLCNRRVFEQALRAELSRSARRGRPVGLLMIDLDRFKAVNDRFGHAAGDGVLREAAARLAAVGRVEDTVARYGGEEFVVMLPELDPRDLPAVAERYRRALREQPFALPDGSGVVTGSVGATAFPAGGATVEALVASADAALYEAKRAGRDRVRVGLPAAPAAAAG